MKDLKQPRRFSIRKQDEDESSHHRFDFQKYRSRRSVQPRYIVWLFIIFAVIFFFIRYLNTIAR